MSVINLMSLRWGCGHSYSLYLEWFGPTHLINVAPKISLICKRLARQKLQVRQGLNLSGSELVAML